MKQAADIMQHPQAASELLLDAEAMPMPRDLEQHLKDARNIVLHNRQHRNNSTIGKNFVCGVDGANSWQQPDQIHSMSRERSSTTCRFSPPYVVGMRQTST